MSLKSAVLTVVISHQHPFINNFDILPKAMTVNGARIIRRTDDPVNDETEVSSNGVEFNIDYDILITDQEQVTRLLSDDVFVVSLPRYGKLVQAAILANGQKLLSQTGWGANERFLPVRSFHLKNRTALAQFASKRIVFKSGDGARGLAQVIFDLEKIGFEQAKVVVKKLKDACSSGDIAAKEEAIAKLVEENKESMFISKGHQNFEGEYLDYIAGISLIQEVVEGVTAEYRLLTNYVGDVVWAQPRDLNKEEPFQTATGSNGDTGLIHMPECLAQKFPGVLEEVSALLKVCKIRLNSIDLFIASQPDGSIKWGIFEFCNQWGIAGVHPKFALDFQQQAILAILNDAGYTI